MTDQDRLAALLHEIHVNCVGTRCDPDGSDMPLWHSRLAARLIASGVTLTQPQLDACRFCGGAHSSYTCPRAATMPQPDPMTVTHVCPACNRPTHTTQPTAVQDE